MGLSWGVRWRALKQSGLGYDMDAPAMCVPARFVFEGGLDCAACVAKLGCQSLAEPGSQLLFRDGSSSGSFHGVNRIQRVVA